MADDAQAGGVLDALVKVGCGVLVLAVGWIGRVLFGHATTLAKHGEQIAVHGAQITAGVEAHKAMNQSLCERIDELKTDFGNRFDKIDRTLDRLTDQQNAHERK